MKKIAFVSGSSKGIGKGIAKALVESGHTVYINGRNEAEVKKAATEIGAKYIVADLVVEKNVPNTIDQIIKAEGQLDIVVSNLGNGRSINALDVPVEEFKKMFDINFFSAVNLCQTAIQKMKAGHIVFISSIAGVESVGAGMAYSAAKAALLSYMKGLSDRAITKGIQVNAVSPGNIYFEGGSWDEKIKTNEAGIKKMLSEKVPMQKFGSPEDIAKAVLYLIDSEFTNGTNLIVDGGQTR